MENALQWLTDIPPVTGFWLGGSLLSAILSNGYIPTAHFMYLTRAAFGSSPWILFTSFFYNGPISFNLIFGMITIHYTLSLLEKRFRTLTSIFPSAIQPRMDEVVTRNKTMDYLYFTFVVYTLVVITATIGDKWLNLTSLGSVYYSLVTSIMCKLAPDQMAVIFFVIALPLRYLPWFNMIVLVLFLEEFHNDIRLIAGNEVSLSEVLTRAYIWKHLIIVLMGNLIWFLQFYMIDVSFDSDRVRALSQSTEKRKLQRRYKRNQYNTMKYIAMLLIPPWYWSLIA